MVLARGRAPVAPPVLALPARQEVEAVVARLGLVRAEERTAAACAQVGRDIVVPVEGSQREAVVASPSTTARPSVATPRAGVPSGPIALAANATRTATRRQLGEETSDATPDA